MRTFLAILLVTLVHSAHGGTSCNSLEKKAQQVGVHIPGSEAGRVVVGSERAQFYSAPSAHCKMKGVFVVPGDSLYGYIEHDGFTSVMFVNLKTNAEATGWVESSRLKETGYGIAPPQ